MSKEIEDTKEAQRDLEVDASIAPLLEGVHKIADSQVRSEKRVTEKLDEVSKTSQRAVEDLAERTNKSVENIVAKIANLKAHSAVLGRAVLDIEPGDDQLKSILSDDQKASMRLFEVASEALPEQVKEMKPAAVHALVTEWFAKMSRAGIRKFAAKSGEFMQRCDKIYAALQEHHLGPNHEAIVKVSALQEDTDSEGGYLVPTITEDGVLRLIYDAGDIFPNARQVPMQTKTHNLPNEATAVQVAWALEEATLTETAGAFGQTQLEAEKLYGRATMSIELLQDSRPGLLAYLLEVFSEKMAGELDYQMVLGSGATPTITGIMNASGINALTSGTAAGRALTYPLLVSTFAGASEKAARMDGVWICSPNGYVQILSLADTNGMPIVQFGNVPNAPAGTILGRPIIVSARLGGTDTLDDTTNSNATIVFGPMRTLLAGTRMGMSWEVTDQVNWGAFQVDARLVGRFGGNVGVPAAWTYLSHVTY